MMGHKMTDIREMQKVMISPSTRFFTETVEVGRISPLSFFEAGASLTKTNASIGKMQIRH